LKMSYRIEEKLLINSNNILEFRNYLSSKTAKQIYQPRVIESLYFAATNICSLTKSKL